MPQLGAIPESAIWQKAMDMIQGVPLDHDREAQYRDAGMILHVGYHPLVDEWGRITIADAPGQFQRVVRIAYDAANQKAWIDGVGQHTPGHEGFGDYFLNAAPYNASGEQYEAVDEFEGQIIARRGLAVLEAFQSGRGDADWGEAVAEGAWITLPYTDGWIPAPEPRH